MNVSKIELHCSVSSLVSVFREKINRLPPTETIRTSSLIWKKTISSLNLSRASILELSVSITVIYLGLKSLEDGTRSLPTM